MRNCKCFIKQYPHGFNDGFEYHDGKALNYELVKEWRQVIKEKI